MFCEFVVHPKGEALPAASSPPAMGGGHVCRGELRAVHRHDRQPRGGGRRTDLEPARGGGAESVVLTLQAPAGWAEPSLSIRYARPLIASRARTPALPT